MDILKMDTLKTGKRLTIGVCIFALLTEIVIIMATGDRGGLFITLVMLFLIYIGIEWARWIFVLRAGFGVYFGIGYVISTSNYLWLLTVGAYLIIAWMFGKNKTVDAYLEDQKKN